MSAATPAKPPEKKEAAPKTKVPIIAFIIPGILAAAASFGGAKLGVYKAQIVSVTQVEHVEVKPPGFTLNLDPFVYTAMDAQKKSHAVRVTVAVEFDAHTKEESTKAFVPRIRDATLGYLRSLPVEDASDSGKGEKVRAEILDKIHGTGATAAEKVLITDLVVQ